MRAGRPGWITLVAAVVLITAGLLNGHGLLLAAGLALAPVGLLLIDRSAAHEVPHRGARAAAGQPMAHRGQSPGRRPVQVTRR